MSKKRKTLREKKLAEHRHQTLQPKNTSGLTSNETPQPLTTLPTYTFSAKHTQPVRKHYSLKHDLYKTLSVSAGIIVFQVIVFFLLQSHILMLPLIPLR